MGKFILPNLWETKTLGVPETGVLTAAGGSPVISPKDNPAGQLCEMLMSSFKGAPGGLGLPGTPLALGGWLESSRRSVLSVLHGSRRIANFTAKKSRRILEKDNLSRNGTEDKSGIEEVEDQIAQKTLLNFPEGDMHFEPKEIAENQSLAMEKKKRKKHDCGGENFAEKNAEKR